MKTTLKGIVKEYSIRNKNNENIRVYSITNSTGFIPSTEYFSKEVFSKDLSTYKIVEKGMIAYNPSRINVGSVACQDKEKRVIVSPLYVVIKVDSSVLLPQILELFLKSEIGQKQIKSLTSGSVRDSLKYSALERIEINIPSLIEQKEILRNISKLSDIIKKRNQQLFEIENVAKSRFIEMFGRCGEDKFGWGLKTLEDCCVINPQKTTDNRLKPGLEVSFCPMPYVSEKGEIKTDDITIYDKVKTGFTYFAENDVLFAKITPCMENGKGAIARNLKNEIGFGSTEFHVLRPKKEMITPEWLYFLTTFQQFRKDAETNMTGSAGQRRVPANFLKKYRVSVPPKSLQYKFARILQQLDKSKFRMKKCLKLLSYIRHL